MYVTRRRSMFKSSPESLSIPPPEGPNSGYLVLQDEELTETTCCGCIDNRVKNLPFPQSEDLSVGYGSDHEDVTFIPVLDQPLSSNRYHVIRRSRGNRRGKVYTNSRQENMVTGLFGKRYAEDVEPKPFDPSDIYQQVEIVANQDHYREGFTAKCVAPDGFPPRFLRRKGWNVTMATPDNYQLDEALGLNSSVRARLPGFEFPLSNDCSKAVFVCKWYCPFLFVKEGGVRLKDQMKKCMFYEIRLEQRWEKIFDNVKAEEKNSVNAVFVDALVQREVVFVAGREATWDARNVSDDGFMWFKSFDGVGGETSVGLSTKVVERMKWEQERVGWVGGDERQVRVERVEEFGGTGGSGKRFGCYVLVERFALKRLSIYGNLVLLTYDFKHTQQIRSKWE